MAKKQKPKTDLKLELIQIPFPEEAKQDADNKATEISELAEETIGDIDTKSIDLYEGLPIPIMVAEWGMDKTMEYLDASANLYEIMGMSETSAKVKAAKENYSAEYGGQTITEETKLEKAKNKAKEKASSAGKSVKEVADKAFAKADEQNKKLKGFTNNRKADIQAIVQLINSIPDEQQLEDFIVNYFLDKAEGKVKNTKLAKKVEKKLTERIDNQTKPLIDQIMPYAQEIMALWGMASGLSIDNVVSAVTALITIQFRPYIDKYNQYVRTVSDLEATILELTLIIDALNNKASEFGSPIKIQVPPLPSLPSLPEIPV